jgi:hypothetical protein
VERSDTHQYRSRGDGFRFAQPIYETDSTFDFNIRIFGAILAPAGLGVTSFC